MITIHDRDMWKARARAFGAVWGGCGVIVFAVMTVIESRSLFGGMVFATSRLVAMQATAFAEVRTTTASTRCLRRTEGRSRADPSSVTERHGLWRAMTSARVREDIAVWR